MVCEKIKKGFDSCKIPYKRYIQNVMLINFEDVIIDSIEYPNVEFSWVDTLVNVFRFTSVPSGNALSGSWEKDLDEGLPQYNHILNIVLSGVDEETKKRFYELDFSNYFGAIQFSDGTTEVYGIENGLRPEYKVNPIDTGGGFPIQLVSYEDENYPPMITGSIDYELLKGSFNDDYDDNDFEVYAP